MTVTIKNQTFLINGGFQTFADYGRDGKIDPSTLTLGTSTLLSPDAQLRGSSADTLQIKTCSA